MHDKNVTGSCLLQLVPTFQGDYPLVQHNTRYGPPPPAHSNYQGATHVMHRPWQHSLPYMSCRFVHQLQDLSYVPPGSNVPIGTT